MKDAAHVAEQLALEHRLRRSPSVLTVTIGMAARRETACRARAMTPLPVPFSPVISTLASEGPTRSTSSRIGCISGDSAMRCRLRCPPPAAAQRLVLRLELLARRGPPGRGRPECAGWKADVVVLPGLLDEVAGALAHRLDRQADARPGRHHHHGERIVDRAQAAEEVQALLAGGRVPGVVEVHEDDVELAAGDRLHDFHRRGGGLGLVAFGLEQQPQGLTDLALVVGDQGARLAGQGGAGCVITR